MVDEPEAVLVRILSTVAGFPAVRLPEVEVGKIVRLGTIVVEELAANADPEVDEVVRFFRIGFVEVKEHQHVITDELPDV